MLCSKCDKIAVFKNPTLCAMHFQRYFEDTVIKTIDDFDLISKNDSICVAASGGKDSVSLLYVLNKLGYKVTALAIDEGIKGYRDETLSFLQKFCEKENIDLSIKSYNDEVGKQLDDVVKRGNPACHICGTFRRHLLNKYTEGFDKIATGHNLDDECQAVIMNLLKAQTFMFSRPGPITGNISGFTQKIKPFYLLKEKEIMTYAVLNGLSTPYNECPFARASFRFKVRDMINGLESRHPGTKKNIILRFLDLRKPSKGISLNKCSVCNSPCNEGVCKACKLREAISV